MFPALTRFTDPRFELYVELRGSTQRHPTSSSQNARGRSAILHSARFSSELGRRLDSVFPFTLTCSATGFKLANDGQDTRAIQHYLGHKSIQHTVRYTELSAERFSDFWDD